MTIETNTEELREILQTVYDLPNRSSGGGNTPDLVIRFRPVDGDEYFSGNNNTAKFSYDPDAVISVYDKVVAGESVNCVLNMERTMFNDDTYAFTSSPHVFVRAYTPGNSSGVPTNLDVYFRVMWDQMNTYMAYIYFEITETAVTITRTALQADNFLVSTFR